MMFRDGRCVCLLDWEQVSLAGPLKDIAGWRHADFIVGADPLEGFGSAVDPVQRWAAATGISTHSLAWFDVLAGAWFVSLYARLDQSATERCAPSRFGGSFGQGAPALLAPQLKMVTS